MNIYEFVEPKKKLELIKDDPDDNIVLECALEGNVDYIISGDEHLLELKKFENIRIVSANDFLKIIDNYNSEKID